MNPPLVTTLALPFIIPIILQRFGFTLRVVDQIIIASVLLYVLREFRLVVHERDLRARAAALGGRLAPSAPSALPFGLSLFRYRLKIIRRGSPDVMFVEMFKGIKGDVVRTRIMGVDSMTTLSHLDAKYILTTGFDNFGKGRSFNEAFRPLLGNGVFNSDQRGLWSWHRSLSRPHFARDRVKDIQTMEEHWERANHWILERSKGGASIDIQDVLARFTLTVGTQLLFGVCLDSLNDLFHDRPSDEGAQDTGDFSQAFYDSQIGSLTRWMIPPFLLPVKWLIDKGDADPSTRKVITLVDSIVEAALAQKRQGTIETDSEEKASLLSHLLDSTDDSALIRHECLNILLAARDTTAALLSYAVFELAGNSDEWQKLRSEVVEAFGEGDDGLASEIHPESVRGLSHLRAVLNETLRLHPPVWANSRHSFKDDVLPSGAFIPAGTDIRYCLQEMQRNPAVWGTDASTFSPSRWVDDRRLRQAQDPFSFQPFSAGPRICLGQQLAYTEASLVLVRLLQRFKSLELDTTRGAPRKAPGMVLSWREGLYVRLHEA